MSGGSSSWLGLPLYVIWRDWSRIAVVPVCSSFADYCPNSSWTSSQVAFGILNAGK
jgi:hypothetical protein